MERSDNMAAGMAEEFMSNWRSPVFRDRCVAQIDSVRTETHPNINSEDHMEKFLAEHTSEQLEEFVFSKSNTREDYMSLIAETIMMLRQHGNKPRVNMSVLQNASADELAAANLSPEDMDIIRSATHNGQAEATKK